MRRKVFNHLTIAVLLGFFALVGNAKKGGEATAKKQLPVGVWYFSQMFGHVHQSRSIYAPILTTVACGHPMKVYPTKGAKDRYRRVATVGIEGYVLSRHLKSRQVKCLQLRYPNFFNRLELSATDMYYWSRLSDLYVRGRSGVKK